ncbi:MAG: hypothetical protein AAF598_09780, partial [Bacteroidota bacterium]
MTNTQFETAFRDLSLDPQLFDHVGHLRLAYIHLKQYGEDQAIENICQQIPAFASHHGAPEKYHCTLTVADIKSVHYFMQHSPEASFYQLLS